MEQHESRMPDRRSGLNAFSLLKKINVSFAPM
jgi:hypothetical protein